MNLQKYLQKYRRHPGLFWGAEREKGVRVMSRDLLLQLWIAGIVLGATIMLILSELRETGGWSRLTGAMWLLVLVTLLLAFNAVRMLSAGRPAPATSRIVKRPTTNP